MVISAFSPLTNTVCSASVGGGLGLALKRAGIDLVHISGRSEEPVLLVIDGGQVSFERYDLPPDTPVSGIFDRLRRMKGSAAVAGRAAFEGCRYASVMVDGTFASGRGGLGLVMASKNLRAVVVRGKGGFESCDPAGEENARRDIIRLFDASPAITGRSGRAARSRSVATRCPVASSISSELPFRHRTVGLRSTTVAVRTPPDRTFSITVSTASMRAMAS